MVDILWIRKEISHDCGMCPLWYEYISVCNRYAFTIFRYAECTKRPQAFKLQFLLLVY